MRTLGPSSEIHDTIVATLTLYSCLSTGIERWMVHYHACYYAHIALNLTSNSLAILLTIS